MIQPALLSLVLHFCFYIITSYSLPSSLVAVGQNLTSALPPIPSDFKVVLQRGPTRVIRVGEFFHLLHITITSSWSRPRSGLECDYFQDAVFDWGILTEVQRQYIPQWGNTDYTAWVAGRIIEDNLRSMGDDQDYWTTTKDLVYRVEKPLGRKIGIAGIVSRRHRPVRAPNSSDFTCFASLPAQADTSLTSRAIEVPVDRKMEYAWYDDGAKRIRRKAILLLLMEYTYRILVASDPNRLIADVIRDGGREYQSAPIYGAYLHIDIYRDTAAGVPLKMRNLLTVLYVTITLIAEKDTWTEFGCLFRCQDATPGQYWVGMAMRLVDQPGLVNTLDSLAS